MGHKNRLWLFVGLGVAVSEGFEDRVVPSDREGSHIQHGAHLGVADFVDARVPAHGAAGRLAQPCDQGCKATVIVIEDRVAFDAT
jgi:hypothetical protein